MDTFKLYCIIKVKFSRRKWHKKWREDRLKQDTFLNYGNFTSVIDTSKSVLTPKIIEKSFEEMRKGFGRP
jgi:hypothetical protein